jgi:hypothetical protein
MVEDILEASHRTQYDAVALPLDIRAHSRLYVDHLGAREKISGGYDGSTGDYDGVDGIPAKKGNCLV